MKKAPPSRSINEEKYDSMDFSFIKIFALFSSTVDRNAWELLIGLYQYLVDCTTTTSAEVSRSLREALMQYSDLLMPPKNAAPSSTATSNGLSNHC